MIAALSSHLTAGADGLIVYIRMHTANNGVSMPYNKLFIMLYFGYLKMLKTRFLPIHPWCWRYCSFTLNHTEPLSLVLMVPDCIQSTKDALVRLFCNISKKFQVYQSSIKWRVSKVSTHWLSSVCQVCRALTGNEWIISANGQLQHHPWCPPTPRRRKLLFIVFPSWEDTKCRLASGILTASDENLLIFPIRREKRGPDAGLTRVYPGSWIWSHQSMV